MYKFTDNYISLKDFRKSLYKSQKELFDKDVYNNDTLLYKKDGINYVNKSNELKYVPNKVEETQKIIFFGDDGGEKNE